MKATPEPTRLLAELETGGDLQRALSRLQANAPSAASLAAMAASLGVPAAAAVPVTATKSGLPILKLVGGLGLIAGAVIGGAALWPESAKRPSDESSVVAASAPSTVSPLSAAEQAADVHKTSAPRAAIGAGAVPAGAEPARPEPTVAADAPTERAPTERAPATGERHSVAQDVSRSGPTEPRKAGASSEPTPPTTYAPLQGPTVRQTEMELLRDARSALGGSPAVALALTEKHRQEYARGAFSQERELIAITALTRLGRSGDARQRADRFRRDYPNSAYRRQIDQLVP